MQQSQTPDDPDKELAKADPTSYTASASTAAPGAAHRVRGQGLYETDLQEWICSEPLAPQPCGTASVSRTRCCVSTEAACSCGTASHRHVPGYAKVAGFGD